MDWKWLTTFNVDISLAALVTAVAALIASIAAYRNSKKENGDCKHDD